jgi:hypothetical protein
MFDIYLDPLNEQKLINAAKGRVIIGPAELLSPQQKISALLAAGYSVNPVAGELDPMECWREVNVTTTIAHNYAEWDINHSGTGIQLDGLTVSSTVNSWRSIRSTKVNLLGNGIGRYSTLAAASIMSWLVFVIAVHL